MTSRGWSGTMPAHVLDDPTAPASRGALPGLALGAAAAVTIAVLAVVTG